MSRSFFLKFFDFEEVKSLSIDQNIPLLRAEEKVGELFLRLSHLIGLKENLKSTFKIIEPQALSRGIDWSFSYLGSEKQSRLMLMILMTAMTHAIYEHSCILAASSGSLKHDAPSLEVDLGEEGERLLFRETAGSKKGRAFCVFNGKGFSFQGFEMFSYPAFSLCTILAAFADSLQLILDAFERLGDDCNALEGFLRKQANEAKSSSCLEKSQFYRLEPNAVAKFMEPKSIRCFEKILQEDDLAKIQFSLLSHYNCFMHKEILEATDRFRKQTLPEILHLFKKRQKEIPHEVALQIEKAIVSMDGLEKLQGQIKDLGIEVQAKALFEVGKEKLGVIREVLDRLEEVKNDR